MTMRDNKKKNQPPWILLVGLAILLAAMAWLPSESLGYSGKRLLVLNSYAPGYKWTIDVNRGISSTVIKADKTVRIHQEYMDTKWVSDQAYFRLLYETYRYKFRSTRFDVIIAADNDAFDFLLKYRDRLFPGTPVVFCGVNNFDRSQLRGAKLITGVIETADFKATIDLALQLHPRTGQMVVINDTTTTGRAVHDQIVQVLPRYRDRVNFLFWENMELAEILAKLQKLPSDSLVFYSFFFRDSTGRVFESDESIALISQRSTVPVYGAWDFNLGYGIVGGMLTSGYYQGETAATMAMRVLHGEKVENIPIVMQSPNSYQFDYRQLQRFGIDLDSLPPKSTVINRPLDIYTVHRTTIWGIAAAMASLVLIILLLLRNMSIKKRGEERLRQLTEELEKRVAERTKELVKSQAVLESQNLVLKETYQELQVESADRIKVMEELRLKDQLLIQQSRMAAMGEMLGNIAHQWRQPLNLVGLKIQELGLSCKFGGFSQELLDANIAKAMELLSHLSRTIDDFRTFATPDKKKTSFSVDEVIAKTVSLVRESFQDQGISMEISSTGTPLVEGYPNEYAQVLLNILMNSKDAYEDRNPGDARITVRSWTVNGKAEVAISDNAGGIDEKILDKIFDPYFTTKELGKGTGLGLFMSKTIIENNMGGRLAVRNLGDGVEFRITV